MNKKNEDKFSQEIKILLIGDSGVGKTSIFNRYLYNSFKEDYHYSSSIGVDFETKNITYKKKKYSLKIFDTAGQERFRSITRSYFRMGNFFLLFLI